MKFSKVYDDIPTQKSKAKVKVIKMEYRYLETNLDLCETTHFKIVLPIDAKVNQEIVFTVPGYGTYTYKVNNSIKSQGFFVISADELI